MESEVRPAALSASPPDPARPLTLQQSGFWAAGVALYLVAAWLIVQRGLVHWLSDSPDLNFYLVQPLIWLGLAALAYVGWRRLPQRPPFSRILVGIALLMGAFQVSLLVFGGIIFGFGDSFTGGRLANYPRNLLFITTWLLGLETARTFLFHAWRTFNERWAFIGTTALLALAMTPYGQLAALTRGETAVSILGGFIVPTVVLSILLTWLADHGGLGPSFAYGFVLLAFEWFSQVQPDLEWPVRLVIGTIGPIVSAKFIRDIYLNTTEGAARWADLEHEDQESEPGRRHALPWTVAATAAVLALLGLSGFLGFRPAVVSGISMEPALDRGDLAIIQRDIHLDTLAVGEIIEFEDATGQHVVHRIIAIDETPDGITFTTQGDNNQRPDKPFLASRVRGKVVLLVPAIGWPSLWLRGG